MADYNNYEGDLQIQSDGVSGSAGWNVLDSIESARLSATRTNTVRPRRGKAIKVTKNGQSEIEVSISCVWDDADPAIAAIETAFWTNGGYVGMRYKDHADGTGLTSDMVVTQFELGQEDEDGIQMLNLTLKPTFIDTDPVWS